MYYDCYGVLLLLFFFGFFFPFFFSPSPYLSLHNREKSICCVNAAVYYFEDSKWEPKDGGISVVNIYHNPSNNAYRVVAMSASDNQVRSLLIFFCCCNFSSSSLNLFIVSQNPLFIPPPLQIYKIKKKKKKKKKNTKPTNSTNSSTNLN